MATMATLSTGLSLNLADTTDIIHVMAMLLRSC
jgi:hypothetical protein